MYAGVPEKMPVSVIDESDELVFWKHATPKSRSLRTS
jgi:hypothetical protein